jgi:hypothetical protein
MQQQLKGTLYSSVLLFFALFVSLHTYAQDATYVKFGYIDAATLSIDEILGNPVLSCKESNCEVLGYVFRITRLSDRTIYGPCTIKGPELTEKIKTLLRNIDFERGKLVFEHIRIKCNGKEMTVPGNYVVKYRD